MQTTSTTAAFLEALTPEQDNFLNIVNYVINGSIKPINTYPMEYIEIMINNANKNSYSKKFTGRELQVLNAVSGKLKQYKHFIEKYL